MPLETQTMLSKVYPPIGQIDNNIFEPNDWASHRFDTEVALDCSDHVHEKAPHNHYEKRCSLFMNQSPTSTKNKNSSLTLRSFRPSSIERALPSQTFVAYSHISTKYLPAYP